METEKLLDSLGLGLSRLLRYSYGGFLLVVLASIVDPVDAGKVLNAMSWELAALSALVIGAGIYAAHRSVVIPIHHLGLCLILWLRDRLRGIGPADSYSPTRWLGSIGVKWGRRILAYSSMRRGDFFEKEEKREFDIAHAESGLIVMTFEGLLIAGLYAWLHTGSRSSSVVLLSLSLVFLMASYPPGYAQHQLECMRLRQRDADVKARLSKFGLL